MHKCIINECIKFVMCYTPGIVKLCAEKKTSAQPKRFDLTEGKLVEPGYRGKYVITSVFLVYNIVSNFTCTIDGKKRIVY